MAFSGTVIPDGTYRILSSKDLNINFDVAGGSSATGANLQLWGNTDHTTNTQVFWVEQIADNGIYAIRSYFTGYCVTAASNTSGSNANFQKLAQVAAQEWKLIQNGAITVNGVAYPRLVITSVLAPGLSLDACAGKSSPGTNVQLYTTNGTDAQYWVFLPETPYVKSLPVPTDLKVKLDGELGTKFGFTGQKLYYPSWIGKGDLWQARYKWRLRRSTKSDSWRGGWSKYFSYDDQANASDDIKYKANGWGDFQNGNANCTVSKANNRVTATVATTSTLRIGANYSDLHEVEFEVRRFANDYELPFTDWFGNERTISAHGGSATKTVTLAYKPTVSLGSLSGNQHVCSWSPLGVMIPVTLSNGRGGNSVSISLYKASGQRMCFSYNEANQDSSSTVVIPNDNLLFMPGNNEIIKADYTVRTCDGVKITGTQQLKVTYTAGANVAAYAELAYENKQLGYMRIEIKRSESSTGSGNFAGYRCWCVTDNQTIELDEYSTGIFYLYYPFNTEFRIFAIAWDDIETAWDSCNLPSMTRQNPFGSGYTFTLGNDTTCTIRYGLNEPMSLSTTTDMDYSSNLTTARPFEVVHMGEAKSETMSLNGVIVYALGDTEEDFEKLKRARFAKMRDPYGHIYEVAIVGATINRTYKHYSEVTVDMRRVS